MSAESMAGRQREISVSEFFTKNRHLLGFDSPARALLTAVKEAVDNSLDAAEEAGILPSVRVELIEIGDDRYRVVVEDNGPGIVKSQVPKVFGKLLYGSKFHRLRQSRGQQGIGISAAGMYGQLTTGKPVVITSKTGKGRSAHHFEIVIDTSRNTPEIIEDRTVKWDHDHGTRIEIELEGTYKGGRRSVDEYLEQVAIANPHAEILYQPPKGRPALHLPRAVEELPPEPKEIKPHPYGVELGTLQNLLKETKARTLSSALQQEFSRVSAKVAERIVRTAGLEPRRRPRDLKPAEVESLHRAIPRVKIYAPPPSCGVPIGEHLVRCGLEREIQAEFYACATRPPAVYRGNPFQVEAGLAYGGSLRGFVDEDGSPHSTGRDADAQQGPITLLRMANRVPLQYQQSACATFKATVDNNWRQYGLPQPKGSLPQGPMVLLVHVASVWVPFTSESKEAIAHYPEILKEIGLALKDCGRKLGGYLRRREHQKREERRRGIFAMYIGELVESLGNLTRVDRSQLQKDLSRLAARHTDGDAEAEAVVVPTRSLRGRSKGTKEEAK
jgi:DNA topoisomerase-6 subunit B